HAIDDDVALPPVDLLGVVPAPLLAAAGRIDRLTVDARCGARMVGLLGGPGAATQGVMDPVQRPVPPPPVEVAPDGAPGREVDGQVAPLAAGAGDVEDGVEDVPHVGLAGPAAAGFGGQMGLDQGPPGVAEVAGVMVYSHATITLVIPRSFTLWD